MGIKAEQTKIKKQLEKDILADIFQQLKPEKWKKKHSSFSRDCDGFFVCTSLYLNIELAGEAAVYSLTGRLEAKPMGVDPIYWDIAQLSGNKKKPLTFRAWGAFKTTPIYFFMNERIDKEVKAPEVVVERFIQWNKQALTQVIATLKQKPFSELLHQHLHHRGESSYAVASLCALIDEGKKDAALALARKYAPTAFPGLVLDENFNDRVNFYELAILHLAGREAFREEVLSRAVPFDSDKLPVAFTICHFNSDSELQAFEEALAPHVTGPEVDDQVRLALAWVICKRVEIGVHIDDLKQNAMKAKLLFDSIENRSTFDQRPFLSFEARLKKLLERVENLV